MGKSISRGKKKNGSNKGGEEREERKTGKANLTSPKVGQRPGWMLSLINLFCLHIKPMRWVQFSTFYTSEN